MHVTLFILRVCTTPFISFAAQSGHDWIFDVIGFLGAICVLSFAFTVKWRSVFTSEHLDVQVIHLLACLYAILLMWTWNSPRFQDFFIFLQNGVETMTFMP